MVIITVIRVFPIPEFKLSSVLQRLGSHLFSFSISAGMHQYEWSGDLRIVLLSV